MDTRPLALINPNNLDVRLVAQSNQGDIFNFNHQDATIGNQIAKAESGSNIQAIQNIDQRQNIAKVEIQQFLDQLAQRNLTTIQVEEELHDEIKRNPTLRARLKGALTAGGLEALKAIFNHPLFSIPAETVKGWLEAEAE